MPPAALAGSAGVLTADRHVALNLLGIQGWLAGTPAAIAASRGGCGQGEGDAFAPVGVWAMAGRAGAAPG